MSTLRSLRRNLSRARTMWRAALCALGIGALAACSFVSDADAPQCSTTSDCAARGAAFADAICVAERCVAQAPVVLQSATPPEVEAGPPDPWACVGHVEWPAQASSIEVIDEHSFALTSSGDVVPGLEVKACLAADVTCASPKATAVTDENGVARVRISQGFRGYLELAVAPASFPGLLPTIAPYVPPMGVSGKTSTPLGLRFELGALAKTIGEVLDPERGYVFAIAQDCDGRTSAGVHIELADSGGMAKRYYLESGLPKSSATSTDTTGVTGFSSVSPGVVTVTSTLASTGQRLGSQTVLVRAGTLTVFFFPPTPL